MSTNILDFVVGWQCWGCDLGMTWIRWIGGSGFGGIVCGLFPGEVMVIRMLGLSLARHWQGLVVLRCEYSHVGILFSGGGLRRWVLVFIMSVSLVKEWEMSTLCICQRHVSISYSGHRLQRGGGGKWVVFFGCQCIGHIIVWGFVGFCASSHWVLTISGWRYLEPTLVVLKVLHVYVVAGSILIESNWECKSIEHKITLWVQD